LYSKHRPDKLYSHLQLFKKKLNISKLIVVVRENLQFSELSYLHELENDVDNAIRVMIDHPEVWQDLKFKELIGKVKLLDLIYDAIKFYLQYFPSKTVELLTSISTRLEPARVVNVVQKLGHLPVVKKYLEQIQEKDIREVNNALHDLYIEEEDFDSLRVSVGKYQNFDSLGLAKRLSTNELLEFKRIAAQLYKQNKRWKQSIELSKLNKLYKDAMETAAESKDREVAEELIQYFVDPSNKIPNPQQAFAACLYTCYDLIRPDVALELAWKNKMIDFVFPYFIQFFERLHTQSRRAVQSSSRKSWSSNWNRPNSTTTATTSYVSYWNDNVTTRWNDVARNHRNTPYGNSYWNDAWTGANHSKYRTG